jgi:hypothetical protein
MATTPDRIRVQVKRPAVVLALFLLLAAAGAWCQNALPSTDLPQNLRSTGLRPAQGQGQELRRAQTSLPDAPSAVLAAQRKRFQVFPEVRSPFIFDGAAINANMAGESPERRAPGVTPSFGAWYGAPVVQKKSTALFDKFLHPSPRGLDLRYRPPASDSFLDRVTRAASGLVFTRDGSGKRKVNTPYLLGVLASAAVATATYRPTSAAVAADLYRLHGAVTASGTFGNFGSTVGGDAGKNIFHEFWPSIRQLLGRRSPKVLQRVEERIGADVMPAVRGSAPAR